MNETIEEIRAALKEGLFSLALTGTLAAIDVCGALESENGRSTGERFKTWSDNNLRHQFPTLRPEDLWKMRCGLLHQGRLEAKEYSSILFALPNDKGVHIHNNTINDALNLDLVTFCNTVLDAIEAWWNLNATREPSNAKFLIRRRTNGLMPIMDGVTVLS